MKSLCWHWAGEREGREGKKNIYHMVANASDDLIPYGSQPCRWGSAPDETLSNREKARRCHLLRLSIWNMHVPRGSRRACPVFLVFFLRCGSIKDVIKHNRPWMDLFSSLAATLALSGRKKKTKTPPQKIQRAWWSAWHVFHVRGGGERRRRLAEAVNYK